MPIGQPMLGTVVKLMDINGRLIQQAGQIGELYIGGDSRRCIISEDGSDNLNSNHLPYLRATGDLAYRTDDGNYRLVGRTDDQVKRMGKRLNLLQISQVSYDHVWHQVS